MNKGYQHKRIFFYGGGGGDSSRLPYVTRRRSDDERAVTALSEFLVRPGKKRGVTDFMVRPGKRSGGMADFMARPGKRGDRDKFNLDVFTRQLRRTSFDNDGNSDERLLAVSYGDPKHNLRSVTRLDDFLARQTRAEDAGEEMLATKK